LRARIRPERLMRRVRHIPGTLRLQAWGPEGGTFQIPLSV